MTGRRHEHALQTSWMLQQDKVVAETRLNNWRQISADAAAHADVAKSKPLVQVLRHENVRSGHTTVMHQQQQQRHWPGVDQNGHSSENICSMHRLRTRMHTH